MSVCSYLSINTAADLIASVRAGGLLVPSRPRAPGRLASPASVFAWRCWTPACGGTTPTWRAAWTLTTPGACAMGQLYVPRQVRVCLRQVRVYLSNYRSSAVVVTLHY